MTDVYDDVTPADLSLLPEWARGLGLQPHPEGGYYRETWKSDITFSRYVLGADYTGNRAAGTAILFLLLPGQQSQWHAVLSAEAWFFHRGDGLELTLGGVGEQPGAETTVTLGVDIAGGQSPQHVLAPGEWQRARPIGDEAVLVSCAVVPGFDFADFRLASDVAPATPDLSPPGIPVV